jgi:hypothetical protein
MGALPTTNGINQRFFAATTNLDDATYAPDGLTAAPIYGLGGQLLQGSEIVAGGSVTLVSYIGPLLNSGALCWVLFECEGGAQQVAPATHGRHAIQLDQYLTPASETVSGIVKASTQAQTDAGTDDSTFVTPKKLKNGFGVTLAAKGGVKLPSWLGGLVINWGQAVADPNNSTIETLTYAYSTAMWTTVATDNATSSNVAVWLVDATIPSLTTIKLANTVIGGTAIRRSCFYISLGK